ncbi:hypothetical protein QR680_016649 [Steinernema hermaphroditum]|uniref:Condensin complex subunit 1 C-terminal domain-containing protein n=1 Tax=Steinernema hermaphroditum TaxID=289476 RepID=A0AA39LMA4_9BILA|nr:hypothetical protein QR680_016649 [Steinernema hermaphroditum]
MADQNGELRDKRRVMTESDEEDEPQPSPSFVSPRKRGFDEIADNDASGDEDGETESVSSVNTADESSSDSNEFFHDRQEYFQIPICDDDLLEINDDTYYVRELASVEDIQQSCKEFAQDMMNKHWTAIRHHFDNFFAACRWNAPASITWEERANVLELLQYGLDAFVPVIKKHVEDLCNIDFPTEHMVAESKRLRNYLLMYVYLTTKIGGLIDAEATKRMKDAASNAASGRGKKKEVDLSEDVVVKSWTDTRASIVKDLYALVMMSIVDQKGMARPRALAKIFPGGVYEQPLITTYANFAIKLLEGYEICKAVGRNWAFNVFFLIRGICMGFDRFGQMGTAIMESIKRIDAFQSGNTLTAFPFVEAIMAVGGPNHDMDQLFLVMLNYFSRMDPEEFKETSGSGRAYGLLITTLASRHPALLSKNLFGLTNFLNHDPATLRSAVLQAYSDMILHLHEEGQKEVDDRKKEILVNRREQMLQRLQCHVCDDSAHVRAKVLNLWSKLAQNREIPITFVQGSLISMIGSRLTDKSLMVRKAASHALSVFLQYNCFGPNISAKAVQRHVEALKKEKKSLKEQNPEASSVHVAMQSFELMRSDLQAHISNALARLVVEQSEASSSNDKPLENGYPVCEEKENLRNDEDMAENSIEENEGSEAGQTDGTKVADVDATGIVLNGAEELKGLVQMVMDPQQREVACDMFAKFYMEKNANGTSYDPENVSGLTRQVMEALQTEYLNTIVAVQLQDDDLQLCEEERVRDYKKKLQIINKKIENGKNCLMFAYEVQRCLPAAVRGIFTGQLNEIRESLRFISECRKFEVRESSAAVKDALGLIWRKDNSLRDVVVDEAMKMFCSENEDRVVSNLRTARNLMEIFLENDENEMESIEETVYQMLVTTKAFDNHIVKIFCILVVIGDDRVRWAALRLIAVVTRGNSQYSRDLLPFLIQCFQSSEHPKTKELCLLAFANMKCLDIGAKKHHMPVPFRLPVVDKHIQVIVVDLLYCFTCPDEIRWMQRMRQTVDVAFHVCSETTDVCCYLFDFCFMQTKRALDKLLAVQKEIMRVLELRADPLRNQKEFKRSVVSEDATKDTESTSSDNAEEDMFGDESVQGGVEDSGEGAKKEDGRVDPTVEKWIEWKLEKLMNLLKESKTRWRVTSTRLFWLVGEMALQLIVHSEETFLTQMKLYNDLVADLREKKIKVDNVNTVDPFTELVRWETHVRQKKGLFEPGDIEDDRLGVSAISVEDKLQQRVLFNMESRLFSNEFSILRSSVALIVYVVDRRHKIDPDVVDAAVFALGKIMLTSENLTKQYLEMFLDCIPSVSAGCRNNMVLVMADLCYRFPNVMELNSDALYELSEDTDDGVRETVMLVLSHLILNDQLKTRGTVACLTPRIFDRHYNIAKIAKNFFTELAQKANILYNFLPDIISRLTIRMDQRYLKLFENIMEFLLQFITKERQIDALFEKICQRFIHAENAGKEGGQILAECFSYCLSILPLTTKTIVVLNDNLSHIKPFLTSRRVFKNLSDMIQNNRRTVKSGEMKDSLEELEETLTRMHDKLKDRHVEDTKEGDSDDNDDDDDSNDDSDDDDESSGDDETSSRDFSRSVSRATSRAVSKTPHRTPSKTPVKSGYSTPSKSSRSTPLSSSKRAASSRAGSMAPPKKTQAHRRIVVESDDSD